MRVPQTEESATFAAKNALVLVEYVVYCNYDQVLVPSEKLAHQLHVAATMSPDLKQMKFVYFMQTKKWKFGYEGRNWSSLEQNR